MCSKDQWQTVHFFTVAGLKHIYLCSEDKPCVLKNFGSAFQTANESYAYEPAVQSIAYMLYQLHAHGCRGNSAARPMQSTAPAMDSLLDFA